MEYTVVSETNKTEFIAKVNEKIGEGWTLLGGVAHSLVQYQVAAGNQINVQAHSVFSQAMTR